MHLDPGFNKLIPLKHPFMAAFLKQCHLRRGQPHPGQRALEGRGRHLQRRVHEGHPRRHRRGVLHPGVNRAQVFSIFTPNVKYIEVTEEGYAGDVVIPSRFEADAAGLAGCAPTWPARARSAALANDLKAALVRDLLEVDPSTGKARLRRGRRASWRRSARASDKIDIQIIGFAKIVGDVMDGLTSVVGFFGIALSPRRCCGCTPARSGSPRWRWGGALPVVWLLGMLPLIGYGIDPMSILVPFLIFSIGVSARGADDQRLGSTCWPAGAPSMPRRRLPQPRDPGHGGAADQRAGLHGDHADRHPHRARTGRHRLPGRAADDRHQQDDPADHPVAPAPGADRRRATTPDSSGAALPLVGGVGLRHAQVALATFGVAGAGAGHGAVSATCSPATWAPGAETAIGRVSRATTAGQRPCIVRATRSAWTSSPIYGERGRGEARLKWPVMNAVERFDLAARRGRRASVVDGVPM